MHLAQEATTGFFFLAPWLVFAPVLGLLINLIFGKRFSETMIGTVASLASGASFVISLLLTLSLSANHGEVVRWRLAEWIHIGALQLDWTFRVDSLSTTMMLVVSGVGTLIHIYAIGYMREDVRFKNDVARFPRFFIYLNLFIAMMMILVSGDSYLMLFIGWEGVGLCSYLLISFWFEKPSAARAGKKAFVTNRVGDFGFMLAMFLIFDQLRTLDYSALGEASTLAQGTATAIALLLFLGAVGKSAQFPLHVWLPDAMEGPTPVSALIHAATMVTAGVYMVARCHVLFQLAPIALETVAVIGAATALLAATIGVAQNDIKRVLAYSTVSQLGYMFFALGVGAFGAGIFHLMTHAFFKALLFLGAGSVIHALSDEQNLMRMGGLAPRLPWTHGVMLVATLAIAGLPPLSGFFSKDEILAAAFATGHIVVWIVGLIGAALTAFYMFRLYLLCFRGESRLTHEAEHHLHESPPIMIAPLVVLAVLSIVGGWVGLPFQEGGHAFARWLAPVFAAGAAGAGEPPGYRRRHGAGAQCSVPGAGRGHRRPVLFHHPRRSLGRCREHAGRRPGRFGARPDNRRR